MGKEFDCFQIEEYKNISNAHFETNKQIGVFFRYFLLIVSAPSFIFFWIGKDNQNFMKNLINGDQSIVITNIFFGFFLIIISLIGVSSAIYLVGLKLDSVLYARTINGTRKYFYEKYEMTRHDQQFRVLPVQINVPQYFDFHTFGILYYSIALINSIYFSIGTLFVASVGEHFFPDYLHITPIIRNYNIWWAIAAFAVMFTAHILYYFFISKYRRVSYLKNRTIGVDIDGVLNKHRDMFCEIHNQNLQKKYKSNIPYEKKLEPEEINESHPKTSNLNLRLS